MREKTVDVPGEVRGIPAVFSHLKKRSRRGERALSVCLFAQREVHEVRDVLSAMKAARELAEQVDVQWSDVVEDRANVGRGFRDGQLDGIRWQCDWSRGCHVAILADGVMARDVQTAAIAKLRDWFRCRLKREPDEIVIIFPEVS